MPPRNLAPYLSRIDQARTIAYVVAEDDKIRREKRVVRGRRGVVEFEAVGAVVELDVEWKGLVQIPKELKVYGECALARWNSVAKT